MDRDKKLEKAISRYYARCERGEDVDPDELIREHPELADELAGFFETLPLLDAALTGLPEQASAAAERRLGGYRILSELGRGGMGVVYEAEEEALGRRVALKLLHPAVTGMPHAVKRFQREARAAAKIQHTNIVPVYAFGRSDGRWYCAMELVRGRSLDRVIRARRETKREGKRDAFGKPGTRRWYRAVAEAFAGVAEALETAHRVGVIHRDVKPANLVLSEDGLLKILDFGLARVKGDRGLMTLTGQMIGTPYYMSPEQVRAKSVEIDGRTDVYSLGATLYEWLTGHVPHEGEGPQQVCARILSRSPASPRTHDPRMPKDLERIVLKTLEREPRHRYATAADLARDLRRFAAGAEVQARRVGPVVRTWRRVRRRPVLSALVAGLLLLAVAAGILVIRESEHADEARRRQYFGLLVDADWEILRAELSTDSGPGDSRANALLERASSVSPNRPEAWMRMALLHRSDLERASPYLETAKERGLPDRIYHLTRALLFEEAGRPGQAEGASQKARQAPTGGRDDALLEALVLEGFGRPDEAIERIDAVISQAERGSALRFFALNTRGLLRRKTGDFEGALLDLAAVRQAGGGGPLLEVRLALLWKILSRPERAEEFLERALSGLEERSDPEEWAAALRALESGPWSWREEATKRALSSVPRDPEVLARRARFLSSSAEPQQALRLLDEHETADEETASVLSARVHALLELGRPQEALDLVKTVVERHPDDEHVQEQHVYALRSSGRIDEAVRCVNAYLKRGTRSRALEVMQVSLTLLCEGRAHAADSAKGFLDEAPVDPLLLELYGSALSVAGQPDQGLAAIKSAIRLSPLIPAPRLALTRHQLRHAAPQRALDTIDHCLELDISPCLRGDILSARALALSRLGRAEEALAAAQDAVRTAPCSHSAWATLAVLTPSTPGLSRERRRSACEEALRRNQGCPTCVARLADLLVGEGELEEAVRLTQESIDRGVRSPELQVRWAAYRLLHRIVRAREDGATEDLAPWMRELRGETGRIPGAEGIRVIIVQGLLLHGVPQLQEAGEAMLADLQKDFPSSPDVYALLARLLIRKQKPQRALKEVDRALDLAEGQDAPQHLFVRAAALLALQRPEEALEEFERAASLPAEGTSALISYLWRNQHLRGQILHALGRFEEAASVFRPIAEAGDRSARTFLIGCLYRSGSHEEALARSEHFLEEAPDSRFAWKARAVVLYDLGQPDEVDRFSRGLADKWTETPDMLAWSTSVLLDNRRYEATEKAIDRLEERHPESFTGPFLRFRLLTESSPPGPRLTLRALPLLEKAIEREDSISVLHVRRAMCLATLGRWRGAVREIDTALDIPYVPRAEGLGFDPQPAIWRMLRGSYLLPLGESARAEEDLRFAMEQGLDAPEIRGLLGRALVRQGRAAEARPLLEVGLREGPDPSLVLDLFDAYHGLGMYRKALELLDSVSPDQLIPGLRPFHAYRRLVLLYQMGRASESLATARRARKNWPHEAAFVVWESKALHRLRRSEEALALVDSFRGRTHDDRIEYEYMYNLVAVERRKEALAVADRHDPACEEMKKQRIIPLFRLGRFEEIERVVAQYPELRRGRAWSRILLRSGRTDESLAAWRHLEVSPSGTRLYLYSLRGAGNLNEARDYARSVLADGLPGYGPLELDDPLIMAYLYAVAGQGDRARECIASFDTPWLPRDHYYAAQVQAILGDREDALKSLRRARETGFRIPSTYAPDLDLGELIESAEYKALLENYDG